MRAPVALQRRSTDQRSLTVNAQTISKSLAQVLVRVPTRTQPPSACRDQTRVSGQARRAGSGQRPVSGSMRDAPLSLCLTLPTPPVRKQVVSELRPIQPGRALIENQRIAAAISWVQRQRRRST